MSDWLDDTREIRGAKLAGNGEWYQWIVGDRFERFERPGEYCMLPWLRVTTWRHGHESIVEAPVTQAEFIEYAPAQVDRSPEGQDAEERLDRNDESAVGYRRCAQGEPS